MSAEWIEKLNQWCRGLFQLSEDQSSAVVASKDIISVLKAMKDSAGFRMLADITSVEHDENFEVVYHLMSLETAETARLKVRLSKDNPSLPSVISVWKAANVLEREIYDLMGIRFQGHDNLKRILCSDNFEGHPLRKNFKLDLPDRLN